jgi:hypothetical protein
MNPDRMKKKSTARSALPMTRLSGPGGSPNLAAHPHVQQHDMERGQKAQSGEGAR